MALDPPAVLDPLRRLLERAVAVLPTLVIVAAWLVLGVLTTAIVARLVRWIVSRSGLEGAAERLGSSRVLYAIGMRAGLGRALGRVVWVAGILVTLTLVADVLRLPSLAEGMSAIVGFIPRLLVAAFIAAGGVFVADALRALVRRVGGEAGALDSPQLVGEILYYVVVVVAVAVAVEQIGLQTALVNALIALVAGVGLLSVGLSFALGSAPAVRNMVARHYVEKLCRPGDRVQIGDVDGVVVRFTPTAVVLLVERAEVLVPCALAMQQTLRVERSDDVPAT